MIKGLSLTRPWPFAFKHGKRVENRSWRPSGRLVGCYIALHAAKSWSEDDREFISERLSVPVPSREECMDSVIFAVARWNGVIYLPTPTTEAQDLFPTMEAMPADQEQWYFGPFGWKLDDYIELPEPVPHKGAQLLWELEPVALNLVREQYRAAKPQ